MDFNNLLIRDFEKNDAEDFFAFYKEEYSYYFDYTSPKKLCDYALKKNTLSKVILFKNKIIGGYFVRYIPDQRICYPHGLILSKKFRTYNIHKGFIVNPSNFRNLIRQVFDKFKDVEMFYALVLAFSRTANTASDLMGSRYAGFIPSMFNLRNDRTKRDPIFIKILYPQYDTFFQQFYDKDIFKEWEAPKIISELKSLTNTVLSLLKIVRKNTPQVIEVKITPIDALKNYEKINIHENLISYKSEDNEVEVTIDKKDYSAYLEFKAYNCSTLYALLSKVLSDLEGFDFISADVTAVEDQRVFQDLGFKPVAYVPLFKLVKGKRQDVFRFIKLRSLKDLSRQSNIILKIQRGYKVKKILNTVLDNFIEKYSKAPLLLG